MADTITTKIPDLTTSWEGYSGERVEEFIKGQLSSILAQFGGKAGYIALLSSDTTTGMATVGIFASEATYGEWKANPDEKADLLLSSVEIPMGSGGGSTESSYIVKLTNAGEKNITATKESDLVAKLRFTSQLYDPSDGSLSDTNEGGTLTIETRMQGATEWTTAASDIPIQSQSSSDATDYTSIDLSPYIKSGTQSVRFSVVGELSEKKTPYVNMSVTRTDIAITFMTKWENPFLYRSNASTIQIPLRITGNISKQLHLRVTSAREDSSYSKEYTYSLGSTTYTETPYNATIDHPRIHGLFNIEAWVESGDTVKTDAVSEQIMCRLEDEKTALLAINNVGTFQNWSNVKAFEYAIYNPNADTTDISFTLTKTEDSKVIYKEDVLGVKNGVVETLTFDLEVETDDNTNFPAIMSFLSGVTVIRQQLNVLIDNSENFAPTSGADFFLNPKVRNNTEENPATIVNTATGQTVKSTFEGLSFISDGWVIDSETGSRCLRVLQGEKVAINYDAYSDTTGDDGLTIEVDFATRNVTDENGILFQMGTAQEGELPVGLWMKAQEACFMTMNARNEAFQNWIYRHDKRTHVAVNIVPNLYGEGISYVRVFINGVINREFIYRDGDSFWQSVGGVKKTGGILINPQGADIDIYALRIYKRAMSANDIRQNRCSSFPTVEEKRAFKEANNILGDNGLINYEKSKLLYNTILYKGKLPSLQTGDVPFKGDVIIHKVGDKAHSGTLYNMTRKGQGSTSKKYWTWNIQSDFKDADSKWIDENGVDHGQCYQNADGLPMAKKLVDKRNWASSMQYHKMGTTRLYNDLYKEVIGKNEITSVSGYENCRVCVYEDEFLVFQQETEDAEPVYIGPGTFGSGKADKPTFGLSACPDMLMIEGSDNNPRLTKHQVPWIESVVTFNELKEEWRYADVASWDYDMGNRDTITRFIEAFNFVYSYSNRIKPFVGTLTQLKAATDLDISYQYWVTKAEEGSARYDMYVYDEVEKTWLPGGTSLNEDGSRATLNIKEQLSSVLGSDFNSHDTYMQWDKVNEDFIAARKKVFGGDHTKPEGDPARTGKMEQYFHLRDIMFFMSMMKLIAGSDNRAKNTYPWVSGKTGLIREFQDDLDSIGTIGNRGQADKPYYVEEHDYDDTLHKNYWNGEDNVLYNMIEECYPTELRNMMYDIMTAMAKLGGGTVMGCLEKYYFDVTKRIPAVAYNEFARIGYEYAQKKMEEGIYSNDAQPITQSLGSLEEGERQWFEDRVMYISSYCGYGEFSSASNANKILVRSTEAMEVKMPFTVAMWMYPTVTLGQSTVLEGKRMKAGESASVSFRTDGDTQYALYGVDYMSDIGTWYDKPGNQGLVFQGKRVKELIVGNDNVNAIHMKISTIGVSAMTSLRTFDVHNVTTLGGELDLTKNVRLVSLDARNTNFSKVLLPQQEFLTTAKLPGSITGLSLDGQRGLSELSVADYSKLQSFSINQATCPKLDSHSFLDLIKDNVNLRGHTAFNNVDWQDVRASDINALLDMEAKVSGKIALASTESVDATLKMRMVGMWGNVDDEDNALVVTYNKVSITSAKLSGQTYFGKEGNYTLKLTTTPPNGNDIVGITWKMEPENNGFASIDKNTGIIVVNEVGSKENDDKATVTANITLSSGKVIPAPIEVHFYQYECQLGDYLFADGTYGPKLNSSSASPVGVVFYLQPKDADGKRHWALAVALKDYGSRVWGLWNSNDANNGMSGIKLNEYIDGVYDIKSIVNFQDGNGATVSNSNQIDEANTANDGYKAYATNHAFGDIGFVEITSKMYEEQGLGDYLDRAGLAVGDVISAGQLKTIRIIRHRDMILSDSAMEGKLPIPRATESQTEAQSLGACIADVQKQHNNAQKYQQYYYPAASYCFAYQPDIKASEELADSVKPNRWFLPSIGELARLSFYQKNGVEGASKYSIFTNAYEDGKFTQFGSSWYWSSAEYNETNAWNCNPQSGQVYNNYNKYNANVVRPVVAFRL